MVKAVIFDFDGTLSDTEQFYFRNFADTMKEYGITCDEEDRVAFLGFGPYDKVAMVEKKYGVKIDVEQAALSYRKKNVDRFPEDASPFLFSDVKGILEYCASKGIKTYVCSNTDSSKVERMLRQMGILSYFDGISGKDLCGARKPSPIPYTYLREKYGYRVDEVLAVEDSLSGVASAKAAGLRTIGLIRQKGLVLFDADQCIASLDELKALL